jgi:hypothetical protein
MADFLTLNTLSIIVFVLATVVIVTGLYIRKVNARLTQSIKLINDLYQLNQSQATTISDLLSFGEQARCPANQQQPIDQNSINSDAASSTPEFITALVEHTSALVKEQLTSDIANISNEKVSSEIASALSNTINPLKDLSKRVLALESQTLQLQQDDPEMKRYSRANQLVKEGASIDEVMEASQLPRAEVEVLFGLQRSKKSAN